VDLIASPPITAEPDIVELSDTDVKEQEGPRRKRQRTSRQETTTSSDSATSTTTTSSSSTTSTDDVIDLTEVDDLQATSVEDNDDSIRIILPKRTLTPFQFSESDGEEEQLTKLQSLRDHLRRIFAVESVDAVDDEVEIIGVKHTIPPVHRPASPVQSSSSSSSSSSASTPSPPHPSSSSTSLNISEKKSADTESADNKKHLKALECAVCLGEMRQVTATTCGHVFCLLCIRKTIQVMKCCPLCKKKLTLRSIHPLYL